MTLTLSLQPLQKLMSIMEEWSAKNKKKNEKTIVLPLLLQEVENVSQL